MYMITTTMNWFSILIIASLLVVVSGIQIIPAVRITAEPANNYTGLTSLIPLTAVNEDLLISTYFSTKEILVFKRDNDYNYHIVTSTHLTIDYSLPVISSVGNWIAVATIASQSVEFFQLNKTDGSINSTIYYIDSAATGWLFPDETFVALDLDAIRTYAFNGTGWSLLRTDIPDQYPALLSDTLNKDISFLMQVGPTYFAGFNTNSTFVYQRHDDLSWFLVAAMETEKIGVSQGRAVLYNGNDTIIISAVSSPVIPPVLAKIYTKNTNGEWNMMQQIMTADTGINSPYVPLAATMLLNGDSFVFSALLDDPDTTNDITGSLLWFDRTESGTWNYTRKVRTSTPSMMLGVGMAAIDDTVLTFECDSYSASTPCYLTRAEVCVLDPTNVTCHDHVSNSCDASINITDFYTINTPSRCGAVQAEISDSQTTAAGVELGLRFTRDGVADVTCSATMLCDTTQPFISPPIPIAQPQSQPITTSQPVAQPINNSPPVSQPHRTRVSEGFRAPITKIAIALSALALILM